MLTNLRWFLDIRDGIAANVEELNQEAVAGSALRDETRATIIKNLDYWRDLAKEGGFQTMFAVVEMTLEEMPSINAVRMLMRLQQLRETIDYDSRHRAFWLIHAKKLQYFATSFGTAIDTAFPDAALEIEQAGACYALACNTASVFHLMRAVEYAMRGLARSVGVKQGPVALEHQVWNAVIEQIEKYTPDATVGTWPEPSKSNARAFFSRTVSDLYAFKDETRNILMHTKSGGDYNSPTALGIRDRVGEFFERITKVGVTQYGRKQIFNARSFR